MKLSLKIGLYLSLSGLISLQAMASDGTDKVWKQKLKEQGIEASSQSYCYSDEKGNAQGVNVDMRVRLASVSKVITSFWAIDKLGMDYKYETKLFIKGKSLHIQGSNDPFLGNEKMFYLLSQLNELGFDKFDTITFDKNLVIIPSVQYELDSYPTINATTMGKVLKNYFNTASWSADSKSEYSNFYRLAKAGKFKKDVSFEVANVKMVDSNPFAGDVAARELTLSSPSLYKYLKEMNIKSNNSVAETTFRSIGGTTEFAQFLKDRFSLTSEQIRFYSGSGLPEVINGERKDNYASCKVILDLVSELKASVERQGKDLEDLIAVPGTDGGTFRNRTFTADLKNSFVAKTGTLYHTSTLAGAMNTKKGFSFFGIFNQSTDRTGSKAVQNAMVYSIMSEMGGPSAFDYQVEGFHATANEVLKSFELEEATDFSSIEQGLF
jgi:D-alanyl-D-alanine carboxypeptidase/D-alanyl-D-alanine-endopeptidase (penicillin-binding protein 4)